MALTLPLSFRSATLNDAPNLLSMLTTKVKGVAPIDELVADFGPSTENYTQATMDSHIANSAMKVTACFDATNTLRGWNLYSHEDGLTPLGVVGVADAWRSLYTITDKTLVLQDRLLVFRAIFRNTAALIPAAYIWGDVRTPGNLDTFLSSVSVFHRIAVTSHKVTCNRYYAPAATVLGAF